MVMEIANENLILQKDAATTKQAQSAPKAPATTSQNPQNIGEQIRQQIRAEMAAAGVSQGAGPATPPPQPRRITIRGRDGGAQTIEIPSYNAKEMIPPQAVDISLAFFFTIAAIIIGLPIARAFARRMDRKGGTAQIPSEVSSQLAQLNQSVDAIALEIERISEGQRFTTRLLSEQRDAARQTLPSGTNR